VALNLSEATVRRLIAEGTLPGAQVCNGAPWVILAADLESDAVLRAADARRSRTPPSGDRSQNVLAF
jgi:hypothetical protein